MLVQEITTALEEKFPNGIVKVLDPLNDQTHLEALIICSSFEGKGLLEQHRMVMNSLKEQFNSSLHALALKTYTLDEWENQRK